MNSRNRKGTLSILESSRYCRRSVSEKLSRTPRDGRSPRLAPRLRSGDQKEQRQGDDFTHDRVLLVRALCAWHSWQAQPPARRRVTGPFSRSPARPSGTILDVLQGSRSAYIPPGFTTVTPYCLVDAAEAFVAFLVNGLDGTETCRTLRPDGRIANVQVRLGTSTVMVSEASERYPAMAAAYYYLLLLPVRGGH